MRKLIGSAVLALSASGALACGVSLAYAYLIGEATFTTKGREVREMGLCAPVLEGATADVRIDRHWAPYEPENVAFTGELLETGLTISGIGVMGDNVFGLKRGNGPRNAGVKSKVQVSYIEIYDGDQLLCVDDGGFSFNFSGTGIRETSHCDH